MMLIDFRTCIKCDSLSEACPSAEHAVGTVPQVSGHWYRYCVVLVRFDNSRGRFGVACVCRNRVKTADATLMRGERPYSI